MITILCLVYRLVCGLGGINVRFSGLRNVRVDLTCPIPLEAFLRAEVTAFDAQLQTRGALQGSRFIVAIGPRTLVLGVGHLRDNLRLVL